MIHYIQFNVLEMHGVAPHILHTYFSYFLCGTQDSLLALRHPSDRISTHCQVKQQHQKGEKRTSEARAEHRQNK